MNAKDPSTPGAQDAQIRKDLGKFRLRVTEQDEEIAQLRARVAELERERQHYLTGTTDVNWREKFEKAAERNVELERREKGWKWLARYNDRLRIAPRAAWFELLYYEYGYYSEICSPKVVERYDTQERAADARLEYAIARAEAEEQKGTSC